MARQIDHRELSPILGAAERWIKSCLISDGSIFGSAQLWTPQLVAEVRHAFIDHPDEGQDDFMTKLKGQMKKASAPAQQLVAEMLWALLLFPSNMKTSTKRHQIQDLWDMSGVRLAEDHDTIVDAILAGIGSGGPGFNNYRPHELAYLIELVGDLKKKEFAERKNIFANYESFMKWIDSVPRDGNRQFRHMLRYFSFPDRVERISSNNDRKKILEAFKVEPERTTKNWTDSQLDEALYDLRRRLEADYKNGNLDFYNSDLKSVWSPERIVRTAEGVVSVSIPDDEDAVHTPEENVEELPEARRSIQIQAKLAEIGAYMNFKVWLPNPDKVRVRELMSEKSRSSLISELPLSYDEYALATIKMIDVLWLEGRAIARAFEVEHTTSVYSGLLRMADLLTILPNLDIRFHIVAPLERREKVFRELNRPVFKLGKSAIYNRCSFISYDSVEALRDLKHLDCVTGSIIEKYEELEEE